MSIPQDPHAASPAEPRAASAEPGPDGTNAPPPRPVMGRPRPKPSPRPTGDDDAPDSSRTEAATPRPAPRPGPVNGGRAAPRTGPVGGLPTPPSGFASPVRPAGHEPSEVTRTPSPVARPLFGDQASSTGWPDFRSTGSGMFGTAPTVEGPAASPDADRPVAPPEPAPDATAPDATAPEATARLTAYPPAPAGTGLGGAATSDAPATHPGPEDTGPAGGFTDVPDTDAGPAATTYGEPATTTAPHPGPGDSGPAGGFTDVPEADPSAALSDAVGRGTTGGPVEDPVASGASGDDLFAPAPATHSAPAAQVDPLGTGHDVAGRPSPATGLTGAELTGAGLTGAEVTGPIPVVRDPGRTGPPTPADRTTPDPFAPASAGTSPAGPGEGSLGDATPGSGPRHDVPEHDSPEHDPQPIVPGLIDPRPVVAGEDTAAAAAGRDTTEPEPPEQPASTPIGEPVARPDQGVRREAIARVSALAVPVGGLGSLAELGCWLAACQGECPPRPPVQAHVLLVAADHGIVDAGVSAFGPEAGRARAVAAAEGRLPIAVAARSAGAAVRVVDVGLVDALDPYGDGEHVVARGTGRIDTDDALTEEQAERAYLVGQLLADAEIDAGADVLMPGTLAVAATTPAAVLVAALTGAEPVAVVGRGSGIDDRVWMRKATVIRDALRRGKPYARKPLELLRRVAGADIVVLAGLLARAADRRTPVVIDGLAVGAAALLAEELAPGAREWWLAAQATSEPAMVLALEHLSLTPVLDLGIRTDDGTAAVATLPLLVTAARLVAETGTAADTGISPLDNG